VDTKWTGGHAQNINVSGGLTNNPTGNINPH